MFTGIIESLGTVTDITVHENGSFARITVDAGDIVTDLPRGGSLAVNGVCLTAVPVGAAKTAGSEGPGVSAAGTGAVTSTDTGTSRGSFTADVMGETLERTALGTLAAGSRVNLERCMPAGGRFDGHVVQGHVDGVGTVSAFEDLGGWVRMRVDIPSDLARYTAEKGSIALNGTSLTLTAVSPADSAQPWVEVGLIPATLEHTVLGTTAVGDRVNVEVDVLAKYAERLLSFGARPSTVAGSAGSTSVDIPAPGSTAPAPTEEHA